MATFLSTRPLDLSLAELAKAQHGVVSLGQLRSLGLSPSGVRDRAGSGRLYRVHRGVYAVGRPGLTIEGAYMAATLATGPRSALALGSAAHHRDLLTSPCTDPVHVAVPGRHRARAGIVTHAGPRDWSRHLGIPTTTIDQTILDLAAAGLAREAERAVIRADEVHRHDFGPLRQRLATSPRGATILRALLSAPPARTRNQLEASWPSVPTAGSLPRA